MTEIEQALELPCRESAPGEPHLTRCPRCGEHFSPDGRFCPFDGEPLVCSTEWDPSGDPLLDQVVDGRYHVEAVIGEGGMGTVYRVRHVLLGKNLALKALRADLASDEEIASRFIHEARTAARVSHPSLVQISDYGTLPSGQAYFIMELLEGVPLSSILRRHGALAPARAVNLARRIAEAAGAAHDVNVVHRDLKPDNVHVHTTEAGEEIKLVDFGLAKVVGGSRVTRAGVVFGTPYYMSPEQAAGETVDPRTDVYALGVVLYEMLTGQLPFEAATYMGVLSQHIHTKPVPPSLRMGRPQGFAGLDAIVLRCLEKSPKRRYASMTELIASLDAVARKGLATEAVVPADAEDATTLSGTGMDSAALDIPPDRRLWTVGALGLLACAVLGGVGVHWLLPAREAQPAAEPSPAKSAVLAQVQAPATLLSSARREPAPLESARPSASATAHSEPFERQPRAAAPRVLAKNSGVSRKAPDLKHQRVDVIDPWSTR